MQGQKRLVVARGASRSNLLHLLWIKFLDFHFWFRYVEGLRSTHFHARLLRGEEN